MLPQGALSIMRNAKEPKNNQRDLVIAFCLVCATYMIVGMCFYISFDGQKSDIKSNMLQQQGGIALGILFAP